MNWNELIATMKIGHCKIASPGFLVYYFFFQWHLQEFVFPIPSNTKLYHLQRLAEGTNRSMAAQNGEPITQCYEHTWKIHTPPEKRNKVDNDIGGAVVAQKKKKKKIHYENINAATTRFSRTSAASAVRDGHGSNQIGFLVFIFIYIYIYITHVHNRYICTLSRTYLHAFSFQTSTGLRSPRRAGCSEEKSSLIQKNKNTSAAARKAYKK